MQEEVLPALRSASASPHPNVNSRRCHCHTAGAGCAVPGSPRVSRTIHVHTLNNSVPSPFQLRFAPLHHDMAIERRASGLGIALSKCSGESIGSPAAAVSAVTTRSRIAALAGVSTPCRRPSDITWSPEEVQVIKPLQLQVYILYLTGGGSFPLPCARMLGLATLHDVPPPSPL
jgi:hypothetical protein